MRLTMVYNPEDSKLRPGAYCSIFRDMFDSLVMKAEHTQFIKTDCNLEDLDDTDVIFFFDPHSSHHIRIGGIEKHPAVKFEYWNDLHQKEMQGTYQTTGNFVHKLGPEQRVSRMRKRGIDYIVTPEKQFFLDNFEQHFGQDTEKIMAYFPHAPKMNGQPIPYESRDWAVLGNGATWGGYNNGYDFRAWAYEQPYIYAIKHCLANKDTPSGKEYIDFLSNFSGALALCSVFPVPKYFEIPAAKCVTFAEYHKEYEGLGFKDYESCIYVNKENFNDRVVSFLENPDSYKDVAESGYDLMKTKYSAKCFADFVFEKAQQHKTKKENETND